MRAPKFLLALVEDFSPIDKEDLADLRREILDDYAKVQFSDEFLKSDKADLKGKLKKLAENPYIRLVLACIYPIVHKSFRNFLTAEPEKPEKQTTFNEDE